MDYYLLKTLKNTTIDEAEIVVSEKLKELGFGVVTYLDVSKTLNQKIGAEFRPYRILGACHPHFAHKALLANDKIGVMLPCNVCLQVVDNKDVEVFTINPLVAMQAMNEPGVQELANEVYQKLEGLLEKL